MKKALMILAMTASFGSFADFQVLLSGENGFSMYGAFSPTSRMLPTKGNVRGTINNRGSCEGGRYEVDLGLAYDYTSDVQLGLNYGVLKPGKAFITKKAASQVLGSMKVSF